MKKKQQTPVRRRPAPATTALAKLTRRLDLIVNDPKRLLPAAPAADLGVIEGALGEDASTGALGLVELKLTAEEEKILAEPVKVDDIQVKPSGQPYLSHPHYTRWFNRAFGRLGWAIVPKSKPNVSGKSVVCPYLLYIHGQPVAFAMGEQEYHENNREQTLGDALEATVASALRRCAKRLGVGLELWDKRFINQFMAERAVAVYVSDRDGKPQRRYRLKIDPPLPFEQGATRDSARGTAPKAGSDIMANEPITEKQRGRLFAIIKKAGRTPEEVKAWLAVAYDIDSSKKILRRDYDTICNLIEQRGPLPPPPSTEREPGEDD